MTALTFEQARACVLSESAHLAAPQAQRLPLLDAAGRVLAEDVTADRDYPATARSVRDGFALRAADLPGRLQVIGEVRAGEEWTGPALEAGQAIEIMTGAPVPPGADSIVMQEQCEPQGDGGVRLNVVPQAGQWIRRRGEDVRAGAVVLSAGTRLSPQALGLAATVGAAELSVVRRPRVALLSTGDELVMPGTIAPHALPPGAIYNSNRFTLRALLQAAGCEVTDLGIVPDRLDATRAALRQAAAQHDLILTSGGVSVGEEDHIRPAVAAEGRIELWQVAIKPGKPLAFGNVGRALFVGLPGNPVSSFVTFLVAVAPLLRALQGMDAALAAALTLRADFDWPRPDRRREFLRVRRNAQGGLDLFPNQSSGVLTSAVWADGLVDNAPGQPIARGDAVHYRPLWALIGA